MYLSKRNGKFLDTTSVVRGTTEGRGWAKLPSNDRKAAEPHLRSGQVYYFPQHLGCPDPT
jgi:hypothetical protein